MNAIDKRIERARDAFQDEIERIAADVREKLVVPACKKYNLTFLSGNGGYAFYGTYKGREVSCGGWNEPDLEEAKRYGWNLKRVCAALNTEVDATSCLGHYVMDVRPEKLS